MLHLEKYESHVPALRDSYIEGCNSMLFEGADSENDEVHLKEYNGRRSRFYKDTWCYKPVICIGNTLDNCSLYQRDTQAKTKRPQAMLKTELKEIQAQVGRFQQWYDPQQHGGEVRIFACFGDVFITSKHTNIPLLLPSCKFPTGHIRQETAIFLLTTSVLLRFRYLVRLP